MRDDAREAGWDDEDAADDRTDDEDVAGDEAAGDVADSDRADGDRNDIPPWDETMHGDGPDEEERSGNVAGEFGPSETIEPGTPDLGNALFVVFGAYLAVLGVTRLFIDVRGFDGRDLLVLTGGTLLVSIVFLGFFGLLTPDT